ncbi:DUF3488 and DUF4129 domain-containing transglutaminase family protein [Microbacterium sp. NPDC008134]|uniref:transglutaminase TgpA family protein n=1 Tax=Microbacterium sp. NPDC008134 TaxID=3364183 RepID=UPI0036E78F73
MFRAEQSASSSSRRPGSRSRTRIPWHRDEETPAAVLAPSVLAAVGGLVTMWPFTSVIEPGSWSFAVVSAVTLIPLAGLVMRVLLRYRPAWLRDVGTLLVQLFVAMALVTHVTAGDTAFFGVVPSPATLSTFGALTGAAWQEVAVGSAPLAASHGLAATMALGFALVAVLLDQLATARAAILPILLVGLVGSIPMIITLGDANVVWFVLFALFVLAQLRYATRTDPRTPRRTSASVGVGIGAAAIATTLVVVPGLPLAAGLTGTGTGITVDASLRLGDDLRQPNPVEVLTVATAGGSAPYLRLTTLSDFDGEVWQPDRGGLQSQADGFGDPEWGADVEVTEATTSIRILRMSSSWLPVPYPATDIQGVPRAWRVMPDNRTLVSRNADAVGADYTVSSVRVNPTLEQIRAVDAAAPNISDDDADVEIPEIVGELAREVTGAEVTDYDRLLALQDWFRSEFTYSLDTPVEEDFDGTGADAVARFLDVRSGYCVHFAGAFALMAESLGMETRIVVGYLPGSLTGEKRGDESIYSVTSDRLHSWPEVLFPGIGWVPFEPTASLGVPTDFRAAVTGSTSSDNTPSDAPESTAPQAEQTTAPEVDREDAGDNSSSSTELRTVDPTPVLFVVLGAIVVLLLPALIRTVVRARRRDRARDGDAGAAWTEVRSTLIDLGIPPSDAESPRVRAAGLIRERGVDAAAMERLADAVERATYARSGADAPDLASDLRTVLRDLRRSVDAPSRTRALLVPRSLFAAPGIDTLTAT